MAYQPNIPASTDLLSQSQADIQNNFIAIGTLLSPNGAAAAVTLPAPGAPGDPTTSATNMALYCKTSTLTARPEMFILRNSTIANPNTNPPNPIEFTSSNYANPGWTRLASGILLKWGTSGTGGNGTISVSFPVGATIPAFNGTPFSAQITPVGASGNTGSMFLNGLTNLLVSVHFATSGPNASFRYLVIGI